MAVAGNPDALIDRIAEKLLGGEISETLRAAATEMVETREADSAAGPRLGSSLPHRFIPGIRPAALMNGADP